MHLVPRFPARSEAFHDDDDGTLRIKVKIKKVY